MKILYTASVLSHICQFHLSVMKALQEQGHEIHVAARDNLAEKNGLKLKYCDSYHPIDFQRSPKSKKNINAYKQLKALLNSEYFDVIICNTPVVGAMSRKAAKETRKKGTKVVYIPHGYHFCKGGTKKSWLIFYPIEKHLANKYTDLIITIAQEDYELTKRKFKPAVEHIYGVGVDPKRYKPATPEEQQLMRSKEGLSPKDFVVSCTKELMFDNNQKTIISAVNMVRDRIPNIKLLLAGNGPDEEKLKKQIESLQLNEAVTMLGYRTDLEKVIPAVDVVVSCSYREGMPLNIIEAMLCERPIIASHNRGHDELIDDGKTGFLINALDANLLAEKLLYLYNNPDQAIRFGKRAYQKAQKYTVDSVTSQMLPIIEKVKK